MHLKNLFQHMKIFIRVQCQFSVHFKCCDSCEKSVTNWKGPSQEERRSKGQGKEKYPWADTKTWANSKTLFHPDTLTPCHPDTLTPWHPDTLIPWYPDTMSPWHPDTMSPWCQGIKCANSVPDLSCQGHQRWDARWFIAKWFVRGHIFIVLPLDCVKSFT